MKVIGLLLAVAILFGLILAPLARDYISGEAIQLPQLRGATTPPREIQFDLAVVLRVLGAVFFISALGLFFRKITR